MRLEDILKLNFLDTNNEFADPDHPMKTAYVAAQKRDNPVFDLRGRDAAVLEDLINKRAFILLCGMSGTGKTTLAKSIKQKFGKKRVEVLDIDLICLKWLKEKQRAMSPKNFQNFMLDFDAHSDRYVFENLEKMVEKASARGTKAVVVVGKLITLLPRSIYIHTLGEKYFKYCATIFLYESSEIVAKRLKQRDGTLFWTDALIKDFRDASAIVKDLELIAWASDVGYLANGDTNWTELL